MFKLVSALRESPRRQPRPNGQVPPACQGPRVPRRPRRRVRLPPRMHGRLALLPREAGRTAGGAFSCTGDPRSPSSPLSPCRLAGPPCIYQGPGSGRRAGRARRRAHPLPNARRAISRPAMAKAATQPIRQASLPAVPRPSGLPSPAQKSPHPKATLGCGLKKKRMPALIFLTSQRPGGGRRWP